MTVYWWLRPVSARFVLLFVGMLISRIVTRLLEQQRKLDREEEEAGDNLVDIQQRMVRLQEEMSEAVGRLARIRRIKRKTKERGHELIDRGLQGLEEDPSSPGAILPALNAHEHHVVEDIQALGVPNDADWSSYGLGEEFADVGWLLPASGETAEVSLDNSGGAL